MKPLFYILPYIILLLFGCSDSKKVTLDVPEVSPVIQRSGKTLVENVRLAINPEFEDWVLFENGTYIIFEQANPETDLTEQAIRLMKDFGPVSPGGPSGDFSVIHLSKTEGWVVSGHGFGMYTYVNPNEMSSGSPTDAEIGYHGRSKRDLDGQNPIIIHVSKSGD